MIVSPSDHPAGAVDTASSTPIVCLLLSVLATFLLCVARGMAAVMIPITLQDRGSSSSMIGVVMALETIAALLISLSFPFLLRFVNMKAGLVLSTVLRIPSLFLLAFTSNIYIWTFAVFLNSIGCFMFMILLQTWIAGMKFKSNKGLMVALYSTSISLGFAFGPLLIDYSKWILLLLMPSVRDLLITGSHISAATSGGLNVRFVFLLSALLSFSALLPILAGLYMVPSFRIKGGVGIWKSIMHTKGPMFAIAMAGVSYFGVCAFITLYGMRNSLPLHESALLLSCFMMGALLLEAPLTWVSDFIDRRYVIVIAAFMTMICAVYLPIAIYVNYQAFILLFLWGGVTGAIYSTSLALIGDKYEGDELVSANAGYSIMEASGGTAGILLIGSAMEVLGSDGLPYVIMLASILYFSFALTRYRVV
ncbi:MFS transporter [Chlorobium sp. BLA1]|uniref:MFS transporter n=1 Tax=Candidatus Chlorobium masyuteum TaxID=2716876 RepID=UPI0014206BC9|nr:MFS transporter [Candidatus Chlorobium masyuteum]NHQ61098.1 MFS transporter [Candidatus Chlorobium masyuteum]